MANRRTAFFVSDRTGITVEMLGNSLLTQFDTVEFRRITLPFIDNIDKIRDALTQIEAARIDSGKRPLVFTSLMANDLRAEISKADAMVLDLFDRFIVPLEAELGEIGACRGPQSLDRQLQGLQPSHRSGELYAGPR